MSIVYALSTLPAVNAMENLRTSLINGKLGAFSSLAAGLAGIICAIEMLRISREYLTGNGITLWQIVRPLVLLALCCNFNSLVASPVHALCNVATGGMVHQCSMSASAFTAALKKQFMTEMETTNLFINEEFQKALDETRSASVGTEGAESENPSFFRKVGDAVGNFFKGQINFYIADLKAKAKTLDFALTEVVVMAVESVLVFIMKISIMGQQIRCYFYLIVLTLLGPFTFALSIYSGFSRGVLNWISRYINISLWIPIGQLIMFLNYQILGKVTEMSAGYNIGAKYILIATLIVCLLNIKAVPTIASYIIDSAGDGGASGSVNGGFLREGFQTFASAKTLFIK